MTLVKPLAIADRQVCGLLPWSKCMQTGICGCALDGGEQKMSKVNVPGVLTGAAAGLHDDRRIAGRRRPHNRLHLFHIVDIERRHPIAVFRRMVKQLPQRK